MTKTKRSHLTWDSEVSLQDVFEPSNVKLYPHQLDDCLLYLTTLPQANQSRLRNTQCLEQITPPLNGKATTLPAHYIPEPFDLQSDIHEYGGKPFWVFDDVVLFVNRDDRCLYRCFVDAGRMSTPTRVSPCSGGFDDSPAVALSDINLVTPELAIAVAEVHHSSTEEPRAHIVAIQLDTPDAPLQVLQSGADFYANLVFSARNNCVAWIEWQHPNMPWDSNTLSTATLACAENEIALNNVQALSGAETASYCQLSFGLDGELLCACDFVQDGDLYADYWNVYQVDIPAQSLERVTAMTAEFGYPHWQFGDCRIAAQTENFWLGIASDPSGDALWVFDKQTRQQRIIPSSGTLQHLSVNTNASGAVTEIPRDGMPRIILFSIDLDGTLKASLADGTEQLKDSLAFARSDLGFAVSLAEHIEYPTADGAKAYAYFYPPVNARYECAALPPAIIMVHGGPTARAYGHFDLQKQFWTSSGFAVIDINHRGSSGYGRRYRDALYGQWGEIDCQDIADAVTYFATQQRIDDRAVCIRGKSAGGYAVLRALTQHPDQFAAGASYYGIGDLATLAELTHKFEKHYTDRLVGEPYDKTLSSAANSVYQMRSPINAVNRLNTPMAIFQGGLDKIVPMQLAHEWVAALAASNLEYEYHEYPDEAHGFKNPSNNIAAWTAELAFYRATLTPILSQS